jgi:hypothetical protein
MASKVFFSFHFDNDFWRTQQVRNMGAIEGQALCSANAWEEVKRKGNPSIEKWIAESMVGKSCVVVLVGSQTANRSWVRYEISKGWNDGKGVLGIRIDKLLDASGKSSTPGENPFERIHFKQVERTLAGVASLKSPAGADSKAVYKSISDNIEAWIKEAIEIRKKAQ